MSDPSSPSSKKTLLEKGDVLNQKWEILGHIATGGMGEVYRARQLNLEREVAVKIVSQELIEAHEGDQEEIDTEMERFRREVLAMAALRHVNVLQIYDFEQGSVKRDGRETPLEYIIMEYIPGSDLESTIPEEGLRGDQGALWSWIGQYYLPILDGVEFIHTQGIVHRDLKPSNVLLDGSIPKITDFGIVGGKNWQHLTRSHHMLGTLAFMAPEQLLDSAEADQRADVYSLGKILYNAVIGKLDKDNTLPLKTARLPSPETRFLKALDMVIRQATAEDRNKRLAAVGALRERVEDALAAGGPRAARKDDRPRTLTAVTALAVVLAGLLAWGVWYHFQGMGSETRAPNQLSASPTTYPSQEQQAARPAGPPPESIRSKDGANMDLIPGGQVELTGGGPAAAGEKVIVSDFYLDEIEVTNHQFVEFLNRVLSRIEVVDGLVKGDSQPWLQLGEVKKGYEPVIFEGGRFKIKDPALAANQVVRVTAYGAEAYARFVGKRLPTRAEWLLAAGRQEAPPGIAEPLPEGSQESGTPMEKMMEEMTLSRKEPPGGGSTGEAPPSAGQGRTTAPGVKGLRNNGIGEWVTDRKPGSDQEPPGIYWVMDWPRDKKEAGSDRREPWEAPGWVGFRCALDGPISR